MVFLTWKVISWVWCRLKLLLKWTVYIVTSTEMNKAGEETSCSHGKRGPYKTYSQLYEYFQIRNHACYFSTKLKKPVSHSTAKSIRKTYEEEQCKKKLHDDGSLEEITDLPANKKGRKQLLGEDLDLKKVQLHTTLPLFISFFLIPLTLDPTLFDAPIFPTLYRFQNCSENCSVDRNPNSTAVSTKQGKTCSPFSSKSIGSSSV